jgi:hypothetical protein
MNDDKPLDPSWFTISRFRPSEEDVGTLLGLLKHSEWTVRWNAARELSFRKDIRTIDALIDVLKTDPANSVRAMASQALGALHADGIPISLYPTLGDTSEETRIRVALERLQELGVDVSTQKEYYRLLIPHDLQSPLYLEIGYLMAQLNAIPFPNKYAPLAEVPSLVIPERVNPSIDFRESYPHGMKFLIQRRKS